MSEETNNSFFKQTPKQEEAKAHEEMPPERKMDPKTVIIDDVNKVLIRLVADNPEIAPGKTDVGIMALNNWRPYNYDPKTGEVK